jgi:hypothetical protein
MFYIEQVAQVRVRCGLLETYTATKAFLHYMRDSATYTINTMLALYLRYSTLLVDAT